MSLQKQRRKLSGSEHVNEVYEHQDLRGGLADLAVFKDCIFRNCKLARLSAAGTVFDGCLFEKCNLSQAQLTARFYNCNFENCDLDQANFHTAELKATAFTNCRLEYATFYRATVLGGAFNDCQLHGAVLSFAESVDVDFSGSNFWGAVIPVSCALLVGNSFDHRQIQLFLALLGHAKLPKGDKDALGSVTEQLYARMVARLVASQSEPLPEHG